ncbi:MAG: large conductance mechanosensitive channel protein MscL [Candidatus Omnitrophica bacterium]|nr:large conductance mechanosensitive channel protein MscL [Candidatus Omnitrophota bacterium]MDD5672201.1 large conductance mechanosensitive channel protein MscL [Candidatus Omnitrophota bacterium]
MKILKEFRDFAMRGNVMDMAIGIIIGGAFGKIVSSFVNDVIMPPIGKLTGGVDFSDLFINLSGGESFATLAQAKAAGAATLNYGIFINSVINFIVIAFAIFIMIKAINAAKKKEAEMPVVPPPPPRQEILLEEIRDLLKTKRP